MPFYRIEQFAGKVLTPHLSSGRAPGLEAAAGMTPAGRAQRIERKAN